MLEAAQSCTELYRAALRRSFANRNEFERLSSVECMWAQTAKLLLAFLNNPLAGSNTFSPPKRVPEIVDDPCNPSFTKKYERFPKKEKRFFIKMIRDCSE